MTRDNFKGWLDYLQSLLDIDGDCWLGLFTGSIIIRLILTLKGYPSLTMPEATAYSFAVSAFAYSNRGPKV